MLGGRSKKTSAGPEWQSEKTKQGGRRPFFCKCIYGVNIIFDLSKCDKTYTIFIKEGLRYIKSWKSLISDRLVQAGVLAKKMVERKELRMDNRY